MVLTEQMVNKIFRKLFLSFCNLIYTLYCCFDRDLYQRVKYSNLLPFTKLAICIFFFFTSVSYFT